MRSPLPLQTVPAFPDLKWTGWSPGDRDGQAEHVPADRPDPRRRRQRTASSSPTSTASSTSSRTTRRRRRRRCSSTSASKVQYDDKTNEEGFLGLAFHPRYKETGEFFVFYTPKGPERGAKRGERGRPVPGEEGRPGRGRPGVGGGGLPVQEPAVLEPRRRHHLSSARTGSSTSPTATAGRPTTRTTTART